MASKNLCKLPAMARVEPRGPAAGQHPEDPGGVRTIKRLCVPRAHEGFRAGGPSLLDLGRSRPLVRGRCVAGGAGGARPGRRRTFRDAWSPSHLPADPAVHTPRDWLVRDRGSVLGPSGPKRKGRSPQASSGLAVPDTPMTPLAEAGLGVIQTRL